MLVYLMSNIFMSGEAVVKNVDKQWNISSFHS